MTLTAADLLRIGLTLGLVVLAYGHLSNLLRFLFPGRVRHEVLPVAPEPEGPVPEALRGLGYRYLGGRRERVFGLHAHVAAVYAHPEGPVVDLPLSGRLVGGYVVTLFEGDRCALTRVGSGREVIADRYRSLAVGRGMSLREVLEAHAESEAAISLGHPPVVVEDLEGRRRLADRWYQEHARTELVLPAGAEGLLLAALVTFGVYLWTL